MAFLGYDIPFDLDSPERTEYHGKLIRKKPFLEKIYELWYKELINSLPLILGKKVVEIGSGGGFLKELFPDVVTSDILELSGVDLVFSALDMPFDGESLSAIVMINTFHHLPDAELFLKEANRVLQPGGKIIMIEPANSRWGRFIYQHYHHEAFDPKGGWSIEQDGPLSDANGALPWIVFERDRKKFETEFSGFQLSEIKYTMPFLYLISGGFSYRQLLPGFLFGIASTVDKLFPKISREISMFMTIVVQKK